VTEEEINDKIHTTYNIKKIHTTYDIIMESSQKRPQECNKITRSQE